MSIYRGYSSVGRDYGPYKLQDNNLIIQDLLNSFNIRKGEKLHNPDFGCIIWYRLFDPLTPALKDEIVKDVDKLLRYDPRFSVIDRVTIQESTSHDGLVIVAQLIFTQSNQTYNLNLLFDRGTKGVYTF